MRKRLDKIRFRGQRRDEFLDVADSPCNSDVESSEDLVLKPQILSREPDEAEGSSSASLQDDAKTDLNEIKGHLEIALLEKHFLQEELRKLKEECNEDALKQELEKERSRRMELEQKTTEVLNSRGFRPLTNFKRSLSALSCWSSIYTSAFAFVIYMHAVWRGWTIPMLLFLAILRLTLNYLISRGWRITWSIIPEVSEPVEGPAIRLRQKHHLPLFISILFSQNLFGKMANILEKFKNLFMWVQPELTRKLYVGLWVAFVSSCLLPYPLLGFLIGVYAGIKFFLIDFLLRSCPKLRQRFDTAYIIWTNLPTDLQVKERSSFPGSKRALTGRRSPVTGGVPQGVGRDEEGGRLHNSKKQPFHEVFNLPESERPLAVCENGWRCYLINRDRKSPTEYIRHGVLYLTESSSSRSGSSKRNKVIKLKDITDIQKYKVLSVLPGSGMGISVATPSTLKPMVFGAMIHRDEAFGAIFSQYMKIVCQDASINTDT
uniref:GRAM domain containing 4b n=1 Tax=Oryzias latipes TaxID=8090 RepID=H2MYJ2_ORYLA